MKSFVFSLERMREYKRQILDREKGALRRLQKIQAEIYQSILNLEQYRKKQAADFLRQQQIGTTAEQLFAHRFYMENTGLQIKSLQKEQAQMQQQIEQQMQIVLLASQEVSGLDKLEEKQRQEYDYLLSKESEQAIEELISLQMARQGQQR